MKLKINHLETTDNNLLRTAIAEFLQDGLLGYSWTISKGVVFNVDTIKKTINVSVDKQANK